MADTTTTFAAALKEYYTKDKVNEVLYKDNPLYQLVDKTEDGTGLDYYRVPLLISPSGGVSSTFANAQAGSFATSSGMKQFQVTRVNHYALNSVNDVVVLASRGSASAFIEASKVTVESTLYQLGRDLAITAYLDGWGARGQIAAGSSVSGKTLTLGSVSDIFRFEVGNRLQFNTNKGDAAKAYGSSGNPLTVTGIDRDAGELSFAYNVDDATNGCPTIAAGDYIYLDGDASTSKLKYTGLAGWLPTTAPTSSDSFFGLNRSIDSQRLAGARVDATSLNIIEALNAGAIKVSQIGGKVSHFFVSFATYQNLVNSLEGKVRINSHKDDNEVGFESVDVITTKGIAKVVADINCPDNVAYGLQLDTWKMISLGSPTYQVGADFGDGLMFYRVYNADSWELRYRFTGALTCSAPGWNCVIQLS